MNAGWLPACWGVVMMGGEHRDAFPQSVGEQQVSSKPWSPLVLPALIAANGIAFAVLGGLDGSPAWRMARVLVVIAVTAVAVWFTHRAGRAGRGTVALLVGIASTVGFLNAALRP